MKSQRISKTQKIHCLPSLCPFPDHKFKTKNNFVKPKIIIVTIQWQKLFITTRLIFCYLRWNLRNANKPNSSNLLFPKLCIKIVFYKVSIQGGNFVIPSRLLKENFSRIFSGRVEVHLSVRSGKSVPFCLP